MDASSQPTSLEFARLRHF